MGPGIILGSGRDGDWKLPAAGFVGGSREGPEPGGLQPLGAGRGKAGIPAPASPGKAALHTPLGGPGRPTLDIRPPDLEGDRELGVVLSHCVCGHLSQRQKENKSTHLGRVFMSALLTGSVFYFRAPGDGILVGGLDGHICLS